MELQSLTKLRPADHVSFHAVGESGALFDGAAQKLYRLDPVGAFIWCGLAEGWPLARIARELNGRTQARHRSLQGFVVDALRHWQALGLIRPAASHLRAFRVLDKDYAVRFADRELETVCMPLLQAHAAAAPGAIAATLDVVRAPDGTVAILHGTQEAQRVALRSLAPAVFASLMRLALACGGFYPALHAGSLRIAGEAVLFPGPSGRGKSTLMAALLAAGHEVLGDDTVVFDPGTMHVRPITPCLCIKSGAWPALAEPLPGLMALPAYVRPDGARVRYLPAHEPAPHAGAKVRTIVFPHYRADAPVQVTPLGGMAALQELLPSVDPIGHALASADIERLIAWLSGIDCYTLGYASTDEAAAALAEMLA